jgi:hypothetical protein
MRPIHRCTNNSLTLLLVYPKRGQGVLRVQQHLPTYCFDGDMKDMYICMCTCVDAKVYISCIFYLWESDLKWRTSFELFESYINILHTSVMDSRLGRQLLTSDSDLWKWWSDDLFNNLYSTLTICESNQHFSIWQNNAHFYRIKGQIQPGRWSFPILHIIVRFSHKYV